jgi:hypothetical protein
MTSRGEKELILDYSLQSESNLEVALKHTPLLMRLGKE